MKNDVLASGEAAIRTADPNVEEALGWVGWMPDWLVLLACMVLLAFDLRADEEIDAETLWWRSIK